MNNIEENNLLIAKFMYPDNTYMTYYMNENTTYKCSDGATYLIDTFYPHEMEYHSSWHWLMPVVSKCYEYGELDNHYREEIIASLSGVIDIEDTYNAVVDFVKWYNDNNKPI